MGSHRPRENEPEISAAEEVLGSDEAAHLDGVLMSHLSAANYQLAQYVLRFCDADAGRREPTPVPEELALADCIAAAAEAIRSRARLRQLEESARELPQDGPR